MTEEELTLTLKDPVTLHATIPDATSLKNLINLFPKQRQQLFQSTMEDINEFRRLISTAVILEYLANVFLEKRWRLFQIAAEDPAELQRLAPHLGALEYFVIAFPEHQNLLSKPTVEEAFQAVQEAKALRIKKLSTIEIQKNVLFFATHFEKFPEALVIYICAMTATSPYHNIKDATDIAATHWVGITWDKEAAAAMPSAATLIHHHGILNSSNNNSGKDQKQHEFDLQHGLTVYKK